MRLYKEKFTGTKADRPEFKKVLEVLHEGDTLVVTIAGSAVESTRTLKDLFAKAVKVHIFNMGLVENTPTGRLVFNKLSSFAEFERDVIVERAQEGGGEGTCKATR